MFKTLIQTDAEGIVRNTVLDVEQYNYSTVSFPFPNDPVVIDNDLAVLPLIRTRREDNTTVSDTVFVHPYTEQVLTGTINGGFQLNEQIVQSPVTVEVTNALVLNGATATEYSPTVGSIGVTGQFLGKRAARFKGTYLDLESGKGAGLKLPAFSVTGTAADYFLVEGFVYLEEMPSSYDPILINRAIQPTGGSTQDSFSIEYDKDNSQLLMRYSTEGRTAASFGDSIFISPVDGLTLNTWHHFAVVFDKGNGYSSQLLTFFDGEINSRVFFGATYERIRNSNAPVSIGCGFSGERPLKGWLDSVMISSGGASAALRTFNINTVGIEGNTAPVPSAEPVSGDHTVYSLNMNGPVGTQFFPCDTATKIVSTASYISNQENKLGVALVSRQQSTVSGLTLFSGVCYGHAITGVCAGPCFGADSGTCMLVTGVEQLHGITKARRIRSNAAEFTIAYLLGSTGMQGRSGASGDFPIFFTQNWGGDTFSYLATQTNTTELKFIYDTVTVSGRTGVFYVKDYASGNVYGVQTADIKNLYADVVEYHSVSSKIGISASSRILNINGMEDLYNAKGFEDEAIAQKVAPNISNVGILYINNNARLTKKTTDPERAFQEYTIEGIIK